MVHGALGFNVVVCLLLAVIYTIYPHDARIFSAACCFSSLFQGGANSRTAGQLQSGPEAPIWATRRPCDLDMSPEATCRRMLLLCGKKTVNFRFPQRQSLSDYPPLLQVKPSTAACKSTSYYNPLRRLYDITALQLLRISTYPYIDDSNYSASSIYFAASDLSTSQLAPDNRHRLHRHRFLHRSSTSDSTRP